VVLRHLLRVLPTLLVYLGKALVHDENDFALRSKTSLPHGKEFLAGLHGITEISSLVVRLSDVIDRGGNTSNAAVTKHFLTDFESSLVDFESSIIFIAKVMNTTNVVEDRGHIQGGRIPGP